MKFEIKLSQIHPHIFVVEVDNKYDLGMTFLRAQEFYESVNDAFRGKVFSIFSYMDWYAKGYSEEKGFTYTIDYRGYNVPSTALNDCYRTYKGHTPHDDMMLNIMKTISDLGTSRYYLLGTSMGDAATLEHEMAHGLFFVNEQYRKTMEHHVSLLPIRTELFAFLKEEMGYADAVHVDETQAFMSTGLSDAFEEKMDEYKKFVGPFEETFKQYRAEFDKPATLFQKTVDLFEDNHI